MKWPRYYFAMLAGLSLSQLGNWIYLIALNVFIWDLTHSPAAVAALYMISPIVRIVTGLFIGTYIDRWNKKKIVVSTDLIRAAIICCMPFVQELWLIYAIVALTNVASAFFGPSSTYLISVHISNENRQRFNALYTTCNSGAFMLGPALGGAIIAIGSIQVAMWLNSLSFIICACLLLSIPTEKLKEVKERTKVTWQTFREDWAVVTLYSKKMKAISFFILIYSVALMISYALDSQEMTFLLTHLEISKSLYGVTVTVAGIGAIIGGILATAFTKRFSAKRYIQVGFLLTMLSYLTFYLSNTYALAIISFITLGLFMAFSNVGFATIYQNVIEPSIMGRFSSVLNMIQGILQVCLTLLIGVLCEWYSLQLITSIFAGIATLLAVIVFKQTKALK